MINNKEIIERFQEENIKRNFIFIEKTNELKKTLEKVREIRLDLEKLQRI